MMGKTETSAMENSPFVRRDMNFKQYMIHFVPKKKFTKTHPSQINNFIYCFDNKDVFYILSSDKSFM